MKTLYAGDPEKQALFVDLLSGHIYDFTWQLLSLPTALSLNIITKTIILKVLCKYKAPS